MQVLQKTVTYSILCKSCSIVTNYFISQYSILEDAQKVENRFFTEISEISSEIYQRLTYHLPLGGVITELRINETIMFSTTIAGFIDRQGNCKKTAFASKKGMWQDIIVQVNLKIILTTGMAIVSNK